MACAISHAMPIARPKIASVARTPAAIAQNALRRVAHHMSPDTATVATTIATAPTTREAGATAIAYDAHAAVCDDGSRTKDP